MKKRQQLGRQSIFSKLCGAISRRGLALGETDVVDHPTSSPYTRSFAKECAPVPVNIDKLDEARLGEDAVEVKMFAMSGELVWGPRMVPNMISFFELRRCVSHALSWPADALTLLHLSGPKASQEVDTESKLDAKAHGPHADFQLIMVRQDEVPYAPGKYKVVSDATLTAGISASSEDLCEIRKDRILYVDRAVALPSEYRIRGHVVGWDQPTVSGATINRTDGWISLEDTLEQTPWARWLDDATEEIRSIKEKPEMLPHFHVFY